VSLSPRREALDAEFVRVETGVVFRDDWVPQDGLAHLAYGVHAARHD